MNQTRPRAVLLAVAFICINIAFRFIPWLSLSFLDVGSLLRSAITGGCALAFAVGMTRVLSRRLPGWTVSGLLLLPSANRSAGKIFLATATLGGLLFALVFLGALATGGLSDLSLRVSSGRLVWLLFAILVATSLNAAWEEFLFRGWPFAVCVKAFGPHAVALTMGIFFGLAHMLNPDWTPAALVSLCVAGWLLGYAMLSFRSIVGVIGLHAGWNFVQSAFTSERLWQYTRHDNPLLSGGHFGLEASVAGIAVTSVAAVTFFLVYLRRRQACAGAGREREDDRFPDRPVHGAG